MLTTEKEQYHVADLTEEQSKKVVSWLEEQGINPDYCYNVEVEGGTATVYRYAVDEDGNHYIDPDNPDEVATQEPETHRVEGSPL